MDRPRMDWMLTDDNIIKFLVRDVSCGVREQGSRRGLRKAIPGLTNGMVGEWMWMSSGRQSGCGVGLQDGALI